MPDSTPKFTPELEICSPEDYSDYKGRCIVIIGSSKDEDDLVHRVAIVLGTEMVPVPQKRAQQRRAEVMDAIQKAIAKAEGRA